MAEEEVETIAIYKDIGQGEKFANKIKSNPFVPAGILGMIGAVSYGIYNFRNRGEMSASVYLMHLRVKAQSMIVGAMTLGIAASLINDYVINPKPKKNKKAKE